MSDSQVIAQLLPFVIFNILLAIPCHFLLKKKGYSGPIIFLCYIPIVGCFFFPIAIGMPDLIAREMINQLVEKKKLKNVHFVRKIFKRRLSSASIAREILSHNFLDIPRVLWRPLSTEPRKLLRADAFPVSQGSFCALFGV